MSATTLDRLAFPIDRLRARGLRATGAIGRRLVADRELRVATNASAAVAVATVTTAFAPLWMLSLGPLLLGVPHLLGDLRYLVIRDGLHRRLAFLAACGAPIVAFGLGAPPAVGMAALLGAAAIGRGPGLRRAGVAAIGAVTVTLALLWPFWTSLALAHLHNGVGIAAWWAWRPRRTWVHVVPIVLFIVVFGAFLVGAADAVTPLPTPAALSPAAHAAWLAPRTPEPWASRIVLTFAFAQQVHYSVWLRLIPDDARLRPTPRTLRRTLADAVSELGTPLLAVAGITAGVLLGWAALDLVQARNAYLHLARFHGIVEFAVLALWAIEGRPAPK